MTKVKVTKFFGGGGALGEMEPRINMQTHLGKIVAIDSGYPGMCHLSSGTHYTTDSSVYREEYTNKLFVLESHATGVAPPTGWSYPTGVGCTQYGRYGIWPNGVPFAHPTGVVLREQNSFTITDR